MVKLLIVTDSFLPRWDGVARFLSEMIPLLTDSFEVTVLAPDFAGDFQTSEDYVLHRLQTLPYSIDDFPLARPSRKIIHQYVKETDIVWIHDLSILGMQAVFAAKKFKKPLIAFHHVIEWELISKALPGPALFRKSVGKLSAYITRWLYNKCDALMVPNADVSHKLEQNKINITKFLVPLGVDTNKFKPSDKDQAKLALDIPKDSFVVGFVGRLGREKDLPTLLEAFEHVNKVNRHSYLLIVGKGVLSDLPLLNHPNVILAGAKDNVIPYYQAMDVFVLPSLTETTSLATLEAMSCGLAVITTPLGCIRNYIENNVNGLFFPKRNSLVLRKKIQYLMNDKKRRIYLGKRSRITIEKRFSWNKSVEMVKKVLEQYC